MNLRSVFPMVLLAVLGACAQDDTQSALQQPAGQSSAENSSSGGPSRGFGSRQGQAEVPPAVLFLGDSLTAGYGLDPALAFPALLKDRVEAYGFAVVDGGRSGDTSRGGLARLDWVLRREVAVMVVALGGNDMLRGLPVEETERNLRAIVAELRERDPRSRVLLAGMRALPNLGAEYGDAFAALYERVAGDLDLVRIPFLLEGVGGVPEYNQVDQIHPNAAGQQRVADTVWSTLEGVLRDAQAEWFDPSEVPEGESPRDQDSQDEAE